MSLLDDEEMSKRRARTLGASVLRQPDQQQSHEEGLVFLIAETFELEDDGLVE